MKLLLDQNLSHHLCARLADIYPNSEHVRNVGLKAADDVVVWNYAKGHAYILVTKDEDFHARSLLVGHPPKVLLIKRVSQAYRNSAGNQREMQSMEGRLIMGTQFFSHLSPSPVQ